jgi:hypothetical protein
MTAEQVVSYLLEEDGVDFLRESLRWGRAAVVEAEVSELVGAERGERAPEERPTHRNGYRPRRWDTRASELELAIPKIRRGSYFPSFLEPRRRSEQALVSVVQQAYVCGVSTRKVDQLVESPGPRISKRGLQDLPGPRRASRRLPQPAARGPLPVPVARPRWSGSATAAASAARRSAPVSPCDARGVVAETRSSRSTCRTVSFRTRGRSCCVTGWGSGPSPRMQELIPPLRVSDGT